MVAAWLVVSPLLPRAVNEVVPAGMAASVLVRAAERHFDGVSPRLFAAVAYGLESAVLTSAFWRQDENLPTVFRRTIGALMGNFERQDHVNAVVTIVKMVTLSPMVVLSLGKRLVAKKPIRTAVRDTLGVAVRACLHLWLACFTMYHVRHGVLRRWHRATPLAFLVSGVAMLPLRANESRAYLVFHLAQIMIYANRKAGFLLPIPARVPAEASKEEEQ